MPMTTFDVSPAATSSASSVARFPASSRRPSCHDKYTSNLIVNDPSIAAVLPLGDNQYYCGAFAAFQASYDLSWGRLKSISHPTVGNHEYLASGGSGCNGTNTGAAGYFKYFG